MKNAENNVTGAAFAPSAPRLYDLPHARSRFGLPASYRTARERFDEATKDYEAGRAAAAAPKLMEVAALLGVPEPTTYAEQFAKMRKIAYQNAALAYERAGQPAEGRAALAAARARDEENADSIDRLLDSLR